VIVVNTHQFEQVAKIDAFINDGTSYFGEVLKSSGLN
jgi:hypothetical protein